MWVLNDAPPNFAEELAKCQRYQWIPDSKLTFWMPICGDNVPRITIPYPTTMRTSPSYSYSVVCKPGDTAEVYVDGGVAGADGISLSSSYSNGYLGIKNLVLDANL